MDTQIKRNNQRQIVVKHQSVYRAKRRQALRTLLLPTTGTVIALTTIYFVGVGWLEIALFLLMFSWVTLGLEVGFHRLFAHKAFKTSKSMEIFLLISAMMSGQGRGVYWLATHRRHHTFSDTVDDPHSPFWRRKHNGSEERLSGLKGLWHAHQGNTYTDDATNVAYFAADALRNPLYAKLDRQFPFWVAFGMLFPATIGGIVYESWVGAWSCFLWGGPLRMFVQHKAYFTNGSLAHYFGERVFDTGDNSRNNWYCALWTFGSALQNTHHAFASSAYLRYRWYEIDISGIVIRLMDLTGLVWDVRKPSQTAIESKLLKSKVPAVS